MTFRSLLLTGAVVQFTIFQSAVLPARALDRNEGATAFGISQTRQSCPQRQPCVSPPKESDVHGRSDIVADLGGTRAYAGQDVLDDSDRLLYGAENIELERLRGERMRATISRPDGGSIITTRDRHGEIVSRVKRLPDGREFVLIDNRSPADDPRQSATPLHNPSVSMATGQKPQQVLDLGEASPEEIRFALLSPPLRPIQSPYTLNEVLQDESVRATVPRIDLDTITFEVGKASIARDQRQVLKEIGEALRDIIAKNPDEVYLVEGHSDKPGSDRDNLILSERRAEAVAVALSEGFAIPPENLITRGFGERYPKIETDASERKNRCASVRRVTGLLQADDR